MKFYSVEPYEPEPIKRFTRMGVFSTFWITDRLVQKVQHHQNSAVSSFAIPYSERELAVPNCRYFDNKRDSFFPTTVWTQQFLRGWHENLRGIDAVWFFFPLEVSFKDRKLAPLLTWKRPYLFDNHLLLQFLGPIWEDVDFIGMSE